MSDAWNEDVPASDRLRVVTVGAFDAAQRLRRSPEVELVRTDDPLDAVAELARPIDDASPDRAALIVDESRMPEGERSAFAHAARQAAPGVVILRAGSEPAGGIYDGSFGEGASAQDIRTTLSTALSPELSTELSTELSESRAIDAKEINGEAPDEPPAAAEPARPSSTEAAEDPELELLESLVRGRDGAEAGLAAASRRLGVTAQLRPSAEAASGAPVERGGRLFGVLVAPGASPLALEREAARLSRVLALQEQLEQLRAAAFIDDLTGAWNRGFFRRRLPRALESARLGRRDLTLMLYDIDDFKQYNDEFGHGAGDQILRETVKLLRSVIRPTDLVCRIGGDEFAVIFDDPRSTSAGGRDGRRPGGHHPRTIREIAQRFQRQVCEHRFPALAGGARRTLTISGGMATFPWDAGNAEDLLEAADRLLLESKRRGKNAMTFGPGADQACRVEFPDLGQEAGPHESASPK